jgi:hypothetical protein
LGRYAGRVLGGGDGTTVTKAVNAGPSGIITFPSKQIIQDPFTELNSYGGAIPQPPYAMEQMVVLAESHPIHGAAIEQKVSDVIASGPKFVPINAELADPDMQTALEQWWRSLFEDFTDTETLSIIWKDYLTVGWGGFEVARDLKGIARKIYHVPGHTMRASVTQDKYVQMRNGKLVWFQAWNKPGQIYLRTGYNAPPDADPQKLANEFLMFKKPSVRSTWYGIPGYIPALGHITLATAARDYNILFFENSREPRYVFIVSGLDEDVDQMLDDLEKALVTQHRDPHRNLLLPFVGDAKVTINPLADKQTDGQFANLMSNCDESILVAHRMPQDRLGITRKGFLGGSDALIGDRLNRFMNVEFPKSVGKVYDPKNPLNYLISFEQLDITDEGSDTNITVAQVANNLITLNEGRVKLGLAKNPAFANMTQSEYVASLAQQNMGLQQPQQPSPTGTPVMAMRATPSEYLEQTMLGKIAEYDSLAKSLLFDTADSELKPLSHGEKP